MRVQWIGASALALVVAQGGVDAARAQAAAAAAAVPSVKLEEVVVTALKRSEKAQKIPLAIQVLDQKTLEKLNITEFSDYVKYIPSLTFQSAAPNNTTLYLRGVSSGDNANHSGPLPTVGSYLDEQPITTIGGTLDVHVYDMARIEVLPGPQGTLYGASSEAGTVRMITNKPVLGKYEAGYNLEANGLASGSKGGVAEGFVNIPLGDKVAVRLVAFDEHDGGYIDNVFATRYFPTAGTTINNAAEVKRNENPSDTFGGRLAVLAEINEDWSVLEQVMAQDHRDRGNFGEEVDVGDYKVENFGPNYAHDRWVQAATTVTGHVGDFALTYSGGFFVRDQVTRTDYTDYSVFYDNVYGSGAFWQGANGKPLADPQQTIFGRDHFTKESNEIRLTSPADDRLRFIMGLFQEEQGHHIVQDYVIDGFGPQISVPGHVNTIWLTNQQRTDRDLAAFTEVSFDVTDQVTLTAGVRPYWYDNSLYGFFGFGQGYDALTGFDAGEGANGQFCKPKQAFEGAPCVDLNKSTTGEGETHKINLNYKVTPDALVYFTWSTGYRPGGINRNANFGPYQADYLTNYELGFKTSWLEHALTVNGALYYDDWTNFQYSFLGPNSLTIIENAPAANIKGAEMAVNWQATGQLNIGTAWTLTDAQLSQNFCGTDANGNLIKTCTGAFANGNLGAARGTQLPYTPAVKGDVTARYTFPFYDWDGHAQGGFTLVGRNQYGLRFADVGTYGSSKAYETADFAVGIEKNRLQIEAFVKNAFNEDGINLRTTVCGSACNVPLQGVPRDLYAYPIPPLTFGLRVSQKF